MPEYHVSYLYSQSFGRTAGWSENFWVVAASIDIARVSSLTIQNSLLPLHGTQTLLTDVRIAQTGGQRISRLFPVNDFNSVSVSVESDFPTTALLVELIGANGRATRQWIKGIWDGVVVEGGRFLNIDNYRRKFNQFINTLVFNASIRSLSNTQAIPLQGFDAVTSVVTVPAHGYATNERVRISGMRPAPRNYANQTWRIEVLTANTFRLLGWTPPAGYTANIATATSRVQVYTYSAVTSGSLIRISKRNVGRPFGALRGRSRRRV